MKETGIENKFIKLRENFLKIQSRNRKSSAIKKTSLGYNCFLDIFNTKEPIAVSDIQFKYISISDLLLMHTLKCGRIKFMLLG